MDEAQAGGALRRLGLAGAPEVRQERAEAAWGWNAGGTADPLCCQRRPLPGSLAVSSPQRGAAAWPGAQRTGEALGRPRVLAASAGPSKQGWAPG